MSPSRHTAAYQCILRNAFVSRNNFQECYFYNRDLWAHSDFIGNDISSRSPNRYQMKINELKEKKNITRHVYSINHVSKSDSRTKDTTKSIHHASEKWPFDHHSKQPWHLISSLKCQTLQLHLFHHIHKFEFLQYSQKEKLGEQ